MKEWPTLVMCCLLSALIGYACGVVVREKTIAEVYMVGFDQGYNTGVSDAVAATK